MVEVEYTPMGAAKALMECRDRELLIEGPAGTGKSRAVLEKINAAAWKYPGMRALICRATRVSMSETVLVTWERIVLGDGHPAIGTCSRAHRQTYEFPNGTTIVVGGLDNPDRLMSSEYDMVAVFEATEITQDDWEKLTTRLRNAVMPYQQALADCNPAHPAHWLNVRALEGRMTRLISRHSDNPSVTQEYLDGLSRLTGHRRSRLFEGKWVGAEGVVYDTFDLAVHVKAREGPWARTIIGVDDGYTNPFAALLVRIDGDGRMHVEREVYKPGLLVSDRVKALGGFGRHTALVDPSAATLMAEARSAGCEVLPAINEVEQGIHRVMQRLAVAGDGLPRLTIDPSCVNVIREMQSYRWKGNKHAMDDGGKYKDEPVKENDHALDALRYAVAYVDRGGTAMVAVPDSNGEASEDRRMAWLNGD